MIITVEIQEELCYNIILRKDFDRVPLWNDIADFFGEGREG